jgi:adenylate cyclase
MKAEPNGELVPIGGGDPIPLIRDKLVIGRRESCDICLRFPNISGMHCELTYQEGYWYIRDLDSTNGIRVNGEKVGHKPLSTEDEISIANRRYTIKYTPAGQGSMDELMEDEAEDVMNLPLLEKAGLIRPRRKGEKERKLPPAKPRQLLLPGEEGEELAPD